MRKSTATGMIAALSLAVVACSLASPVGHTVRSAEPMPTAAPPLGSAPGCTTATARAPSLPRVGIAMTQVPGAPFGVVVTPDGRWDFVSQGAFVGVYANRGADGPALASRVPLPAGWRGGYSLGLGEALTPAGRYLLVADGGVGAFVLDVSKTEHGRPGAVVGTLSGGPLLLGGAIEVAVTPDGGFAFVSVEGNASVAVFNLRRALTAGFGASDYVGTIAVGFAPVGLAISPDGRWLYVTSERAAAYRNSPTASAPGTLSVISVSKAETDPAASVLATVDAGCQPVRVVTSADGAVVWVTARASDALLGFSAARLITDPRHALITAVRVGEAPVGLALVKHGTWIVVADSNRFNLRGISASLAVVDVADALTHRSALAGYLRAGRFPREMAVVLRGRTLIVTNYDSGQLESVNLSELP